MLKKIQQINLLFSVFCLLITVPLKSQSTFEYLKIKEHYDDIYIGAYDFPPNVESFGNFIDGFLTDTNQNYNLGQHGGVMESFTVKYEKFKDKALSKKKFNAKNDSLKYAKNTIYIELLGSGGLYSINYDRIFYMNKKIKISGRLGISYLPEKIDYQEDTRNLPIISQINLLKNIGLRWSIETGIGLTYIVFFYKDYYYGDWGQVLQDSGIERGIWIPANIGIRYHAPNDHYFFKLALIPVIVTKMDRFFLFTEHEALIIWYGIGIGYSF